MLVREVITDAATGKTTERMVDMPGVVSADEAAEIERIATHNEAIKSQLLAADLDHLRALYEGDAERIAQHKAAQDALRAQLLPAD